MTVLLIVPEHDGDAPYPGDIEPGYYTRNETADLLREHRDCPEAVQFIADMLEE